MVFVYSGFQQNKQVFRNEMQKYNRKGPSTWTSLGWRGQKRRVFKYCTLSLNHCITVEKEEEKKQNNDNKNVRFVESAANR